MLERLRQAIPVVIGARCCSSSPSRCCASSCAPSAGPTCRRAVLHMPPWQRIAAAMALTALELRGAHRLRSAGVRLHRQDAAAPRALPLASFLAYAISNNVGFAMLSGASVRYRFYTRWGVTAEELSRIVFSYSVTFWLGLFALGGLSLVVSPLADVQRTCRSRRSLAPAGVAPDADRRPSIC